MFRPLIIAALLAAPAALPAQQQAASDTSAQNAPGQNAQAQNAQAQTGRPPQRIRSVTLTGTDKCPESTAQEVVVCNRLNPNDQYRVPKELRRPLEVPAQNQSWVNRAATADQVSRVAGGLPDTCSVVGSGGQTGCALAQARAWAAARAAAAAENRQSTPPPQ